MEPILSPYPPPLKLKREPLITTEQSARIHDMAKRILGEIGMEVHHPEVLEKLRTQGLRIAGQRMYFEPQLIDEVIDDMRHTQADVNPPPTRQDDGSLTLAVSSYSLYVHDLETDSVVPYTTERLIEMTKFIDTLAEMGVVGTPPGIPAEVHPDLQPVAQYRIAALYARQGATPCDPTSAKTVHYILDMAEVMGRPIRQLPVYIPTPLRFGGESLDVVLACRDRVDQIRVGSMPSTGTSAPLHPFGALALSAAESIGGMIAVRMLTGKPVTFIANIFPTNLRDGSVVFGSPENMLFQMLCPDFNRFYGWQGDSAPDNIHIMAKLPDGQSAAEKAAIMTLGASLGARYFTGAGTLSLDEIFNPEQLLLDCEIRDWVQRAIQGVWMGEEVVDDWLDEIREGITKGFIGLPSTLDHYRTQTWYPKWFARGAIGPWLNQGQPRLSNRLRHEVRKRISSYNFELDGERKREIERIYAAAEQTVAG